MLTIAVSSEVEDRLRVEASRQGNDVAEYAERLIEAALPPKPVMDQVTIDLLDQWDREQATDDPEEIARRQKECEAFMEGMNRNRLEMEGPCPGKSTHEAATSDLKFQILDLRFHISGSIS